MSRILIFPYKAGSASARSLAKGLGAILMHPEPKPKTRLYTPRGGDFVVNWGHSSSSGSNARLRAILSLTGLSQNPLRLLNKPDAVKLASNKLITFSVLEEAGVAIPEYTTDASRAYEWSDESSKVYARKKLTGHSGEGIEVVSFGRNVPQAPLYVKGIENHGEYRVHVVDGKVIDYIKKRRHRDDQPNEEQSNIRNLDNGWIYTRDNLKRLERVEQLAVRAINALGLDFGAVDIIKDQNGDVFVLEVNTACGLSGTTLENYIAAFKKVINPNA